MDWKKLLGLTAPLNNPDWQDYLVLKISLSILSEDRWILFHCYRYPN